MINFKELETISNYLIEKELGRGAFGLVCLAKKKNRLINKQVALKIFEVDSRDLTRYRTLQQEAKLWSHIESHPNIVPIYDANIYGNYLVLESEYIAGGSLESYLSKQANNQLEVTSAVKMTIKILNGLDHLHKSNIIHRDLKPANILVQENEPKLVDFGLARVTNDANNSFIAAGTPFYMPPEAFDGERSPQVDIWSVGIILYQILVGNLPFPEEAKNNCYKLQRFLSTEDCLVASPVIPEPLQKIIKQALERDCAKRYTSANEMKEVLKTYQNRLLAESITQDINQTVSETISRISQTVTEFIKQQISQLTIAFETSPYNIQTTSTNFADYPKKKYDSKNFYYDEENLHLALAEINSKIKDDESYIRRGNFYRYIGETEKSLVCFNKAIEINPHCAEAYYGLGNVYYYDQQDVEIALTNYNKAIEIMPSEPSYYNGRGNVYRHKKEFDKSISDFTKAIEISENPALAYNNRGVSYKCKGELQKAIEDYNKAISLNPNYAVAYYNRANVYKTNKDYENAIKDFSKAIELRPAYTLAYYQRAFAYEYKGDSDKAISDFNEVIKLDDENVDAYVLRGLLYKKQGEQDKAISDLRKALEINPNDKEAKELLFELETM